MEIFAVILVISIIVFVVSWILILLSFVLSIVFENYAFGDICDIITKFCIVALVISCVVGILSGFAALFAYISSQPMRLDV